MNETMIPEMPPSWSLTGSAEIRSGGGTVRWYAGDVTDDASLRVTVADISETLGRINILVMLAGGDGTPTPSAELDPQRWRAVVDSDLNSVFCTVHAALPGMREGGGSIVTVASSAGRRPSQANAAYAAAKAGVVMLTEHLAKEYARDGIRVNCVSPSIIDTVKLRGRATEELVDSIAARVPLGRIGRPTDVAEAIAFFASDASAWITGAVLDVTGGTTL